MTVPRLAWGHRAVEWTNRKYDELSIGVIQHIAAVPADRVFTEATAQAVATFQQTNASRSSTPAACA